jgi:3-deoxy-D-manno-octulosonic-acid transferase
VQSQLYKERFEKMGIDPSKIVVTGNLKFDAAPTLMSPEEKARWQEELGLSPQDPLLVIGSTHAPEEEWILAALDPHLREIPTLKILIVPRHPERFASVKEHLLSRGFSSLSYTQRSSKTGNERIILIDTMGLLHRCYELATLAIVAGSFIDTVGGHNIFEPISLGIPVLFGPHMHSQPDLVPLILEKKAGIQVTLQQLPSQTKELLQNPSLRNTYAQACRSLSIQVQGSARRTLEKIKNEIVV